MGGLPVERLRDYLRQLPLGVRARLIAELERAAARGDDIPGGAAVLEEVRGTMQESAPAPRRGTPRELFFKAVEPFLVDDPVEQKRRGRIARIAIDRIWSWIGRDLAPAEATIFCDEAGRALIADDAAMCEHLVCDFHRCVIAKTQAVIAHTAGDDRARRRLIGQVGTAQPLADVADLVTILSARETLAFVESRWPTQIRNFAEAQLESVKALLDSPPCSQRELLPYILIMVSVRLVAPWQLIRLAVSSAESDDATRIAVFPYACAVDIVLADIERTVGWLKAELRRGATDSVVALMRHIHDGARGLRTELDLSGDTPWTRRLAAIRTDVSDALKAEIESVPGRVRRLLRPRPASEIARSSMLDASEVAETEALIELVGACCNYASELASAR